MKIGKVGKSTYFFVFNLDTAEMQYHSYRALEWFNPGVEKDPFSLYLFTKSLFWTVTLYSDILCSIFVLFRIEITESKKINK